MTAVNEDYLADFEASVRAAYVELGGEEPNTETMSWVVVEGMLWDLLSEDAVEQSTQAVARERAGLQDAPATGEDPGQRYVRDWLDLGSDYEASIAERLGAERAHDLRLMNDGWSEKSKYGEGQCPHE